MPAPARRAEDSRRPASPGVLAAALLPGTAALAVAWLAGSLDPEGALLGGVILLAGALWTTRRSLRRRERLRRYLGAVGAAKVPDPELREDVVRTIGPASRHLLSRLESAVRTAADRSGDAPAQIAPVLQELPEPLLLLDDRLRVVWHNRAAAALARRNPVGHPLTAMLRAPDLVEAVEKTVAGSALETVEFQQPAPVARTFVAEIRRLPGAGDSRILVILRDLTEQRRSEQTRADFVANVSHELRTPLATLAGFIETLSGPARDDRAAGDRFLAIMREQAERMTRLVEDLLSLSRIEIREHAAPTDPVRLVALVERVVAGLRPQVERRRMTVVVDLPPDLPAVLGDEDELTQVLQNLVHNAIKYGREGTDVEISGEREGDAMVAVTVRDYGDGIPPEHVPRLTERFYRVDTARSRALGGTGLGLAIVKHIVNRHRGRLVIRSRLGEGSRFTVMVPVAPHDDRTGVTNP